MMKIKLQAGSESFNATTICLLIFSSLLSNSRFNRKSVTSRIVHYLTPPPVRGSRASDVPDICIGAASPKKKKIVFYLFIFSIRILRSRPPLPSSDSFGILAIFFFFHSGWVRCWRGDSIRSIGVRIASFGPSQFRTPLAFFPALTILTQTMVAFS